MSRSPSTPAGAEPADAFGKAVGSMLQAAAGLTLPPTALSQLQADYLKEATALWNSTV